MPFTIFQNEKTPFQALKTRSSKSPKIDIFQKGLSHGFGLKLAIFPIFFLGNIGQENVCYDILERENALFGYKNNKFRKSKNLHFSKGVNPWFWSKNGHLSNFFLKAMQARKMSFKILSNEKTPFLAIKTRSLNVQKLTFFQRG